jgi:lysophospholipase L1-like esterase
MLSLKKRIIYSGIIYLMVAVAWLIAFEVYVRISTPDLDLYVATGRIPGQNPMADWAYLDAFSAFRPKPGFYSNGKTVNRYGFISTPEIDMRKPADTYRIVFLGGSSTAGTGVNLKDEETWPWKTVELIRAATGMKVDFINGSAGGYTSFESYGRLWSRIRHFSPNAIVVYHGWNEMYYFNRVDTIEAWRTLSNGSWSFDGGGARIKLHEPSWIDPAIRWSKALSALRLMLAESALGEVGADTGSALSSSFDKRGLEIWRTNLKLIRETSRVMDARLFIAKQATLIVPDRRRCALACRYEFHGFDHNAHVEAFQSIYDIIDEEFPPESVVDVTPISGQPEYFYDHIHPTPKGTTEIARIMASHLIPALRTPPRRPR